MNVRRWALLMSFEGQTLPLTTDEIKEGWHFCNDFDGLLVGPGMGEMAHCHCFEEESKLLIKPVQ